MADTNRLLQLSPDAMEWLVEHIIGEDVEGNHVNLTPTIISEMVPFRMAKGRRLFRGHFAFGYELVADQLGDYPVIGATFILKGGPTSWTYDESVARGFSEIDNFGYVIEATFQPDDTIFDNFSLNHVEQAYLEDKIHEARNYVRDLGREAEVLVKEGTYTCKIIDFHDDADENKETTAGPKEERLAEKMRRFTNWVKPTESEFLREMDDETIFLSKNKPWSAEFNKKLFDTAKVSILSPLEAKEAERGGGDVPEVEWLLDPTSVPEPDKQDGGISTTDFRYWHGHHKEGGVIERMINNKPLTMPIYVQWKRKDGTSGPKSGMFESGRHRAAYSIALGMQLKVFEVDADLMAQAEQLWMDDSLGVKQPITAGMLDYPRKRLPAEVWLYEENEPLPRLQPKLRAKILSEARYRLAKFGAKLMGAMLYGGAATYQYKEGADIDVSLYIDWDDFKGSEELLQEAFKNVEIDWPPYVLHLFVKPSTQTEQVEVADASYNVLRDQWSLPPLVLPRDFDPEVFFNPMLEIAEKKAQQIDLQMGEVAREWSRLKKLLRALQEGARDEHVVRDRMEVTKKVLIDKIDILCENFVEIWKNRKKLHDQLRQRFIQDESVGRYERFQLPEVTWKYLDEMGYVEFLKVLAKAQEAGVIERLIMRASPQDMEDEDEQQDT